MNVLRSEIRSFLALREPAPLDPPRLIESVGAEGYTRKLIAFQASDGDAIPAFLFEPTHSRPRSAVVALHQHNSDWTLGKSEITGLAGDPLQAFGPALARAGVTVLAPDMLGFESRRASPQDGWLQYYNHMAHRLVRGEFLMTKMLSDIADAVTTLRQLASCETVGLAGHSMGGNLALFAAALDTRIAFTCASGAACSYRHKLAHGAGLEMALVIPSFAARYDLEDLMRCIAPRKLFLVSSDADPYSADADDLVERAQPAFNGQALQHLRTAGAHALDAQRFEAIVAWLTAEAATHTP